MANKFLSSINLTAGLEDKDGDLGTSGQVLVSTGSQVNWADSSTVIGGPYLPLTAGSGEPLTGDLYLTTKDVKFDNGKGITWDGQSSSIKNTGGVTTLSGYSGNTFYSAVSSADTIFTNNQSGELMRIEGTGNVGIGTASPAKKLVVKSSGADDGIVLLRNSTSGIIASVIETGSGDGAVLLANNAAATTVLLRGSGSNYINSGNVGIGTTSPTQKLEVNGNVKLDWSLIGRGFRSANRGEFHLNATGATDVSEMFFGYGNGFTEANIRWGLSDRGTADGRLHIYRGPANGGFAEVMTFTSGNHVIVPNGNVGIGTTSPIEKLNVVETTTTAGTFFPIAISGARYQADYGVGIAFRPENNSTAYANKTAIVASGGGYGYNQADLHFCLNQSATITTEVSLADSRMTIKKSGNVGIGTTSPLTILHVGTGTDANLPITLAPASGGNVEFRSTTSTGSFTFTNANGSSEKVRITSAGNVGIGTTSPTSAQLQIETTSNVQGLRIYQTQPSPGAVIYNSIGNLLSNSDGLFRVHQQGTTATAPAVTIRQDGTGDIINLFGGASEVFTVLKSGNVGIGTTSPGEKLVVFGAHESLKDVLGVYNAVTGTSALNKGAAIRIGKDADGQYSTKIATIYEDNNPNFLQPALAFYTMHNTYLKNSETEKMRISSNGNVGIGDTSPSYKLDVNGTIRATGDVIAYSDARVKDNVNTIDNALDKVTKLRGVSYTRNDVEDKTTKIGVIAQEVLEVLPEVVQQDDEGRYSVAYGNMVGLLIESIKELKAEVDELKKNQCGCKR